MSEEEPKLPMIQPQTDFYGHAPSPTLLTDVMEWCLNTFPADVNIIDHIKEEVSELEESGDEEEVADILILLLHYCALHEIDPLESLQAKFEIVQQREWEPPDDKGIVRRRV